MATYVNDLRLKEIVTGEESGTWGTSTNTNLELIGESMGYGTEAVANASTHTITMADGASDGFRCTFLRLTGGGQACTVTLAPNTLSHTWIIRNTTSYALTLTQGSGANVIIAAGQAKIVTADGLGAGAVVYECLEDLELGGTLSVGIDDTGQDVKFYGATSGAYWLWDESADGVVQQGTLTVGVDDTGYDVKLFGATSGNYLLWDESADSLLVNGDIDMVTNGNRIDLDTDNDTSIRASADDTITVEVGGSDLIALTTTSTFSCPVTVGVDDTGYDVKFFGATAGKYALWDESADSWIISGTQSTVTLGTSNFIAGVNAGNSIASGGNYNVCVGDEAGTALTTGDNVVAVGYQALSTEDANGNNTAVGYTALKVLDAGASGHNTAVGYVAGAAMTTGIQNSFFGALAGDALTDADYNTGLGVNALTTDTLGSRSVALGHNTLNAQNFTTATDTYNVAIGFNAGVAMTVGLKNCIIGGLAGDVLTDADFNVALGNAALSADTLGSRSVAIGFQALLTQNFTTATDVYNVGCGYNAGALLTTGVQNTLIGGASGTSTTSVTTGSKNVLVGYACHTSAVDSDQAHGLGYNLDCVAGYTTLGNAGDDIRAPHGSITWETISDERVKKDIQDSTAGLSFINDLRPRTFNYKNKGDIPVDFNGYEEGSTEAYRNSKTQHGFIAQEVKATIDKHSDIKDGFSMWSGDSLGGQQRVGETAMIPMLVKAIQEQNALIEALTARITTLEE